MARVHVARFAPRVLAAAGTLALWALAAHIRFDLSDRLFLAIGSVTGVLPITLSARMALDSEPTPHRAALITEIVHYALVGILGVATIEAVTVARTALDAPIPIPEELGLALLALTGVCTALTVLSLVHRRILSRGGAENGGQLLSDSFYAWTRNPVVVSALAFLFALGLWLRSSLFAAWVIVFVTPAAIAFLKLYEERELEVRFGEAYREYKARTQMLLPFRPSRRVRP